MRIVIPGGGGQVGGIFARAFRARGHEVQILGRGATDPRLRWDGRTPGPWCETIDGADVVINLAGRSVNCRYHWQNLNEMMASRLDSALALGHAIAAARRPPRVWLQASTASIYTHRLDADQTERDGIIDACAAGMPAYWGYSTHIARAWELAQASVATPETRQIALRLGFTMSPDPGGIFDWLVWLVRIGFGGPFCGGRQYVAWIADEDLVAAVDYLIAHDDLSGPVNLTAPEPLPNADFMRILRDALGARVGLPIAGWMSEIGALALQTDTELLRKSRRVVPARLLDHGFSFRTPTWREAAGHLAARLPPGR